MNISYKDKTAKTFNNLIKKYADQNIESDVFRNQTFLLNFPNIELFTPLNNIFANFNNLNLDEKNLIEIIIAINIDNIINILNLNNHESLANIFLFAKTHSIDIQENDILFFYFANLEKLFNENKKNSLILFIRIIKDNLLMIDKGKLTKLFNFFEKQNFENKNELIFVLSDLYLLKKCIFTDDQIVKLLEQIYIFCSHSQYQLLEVAQNILINNLQNELMTNITNFFMEDIEQEVDFMETDSKYLDNFFKFYLNYFKTE